MSSIDLIRRLENKQLELISGIHERIRPHFGEPAELAELTKALSSALSGLETLNRMAIAAKDLEVGQ